MKKLGLALSAITMVVTLASFRSAPSTNVVGTANKVELSAQNDASVGEVAFTRVVVAAGRYVVRVTSAYTHLLDDAAKTCWVEANIINTKNVDFEKSVQKTKMADLG
jgi:hypothetical protein